jgi:predicted lipoprotein with Yx(FWY)xxD motif
MSTQTANLADIQHTHDQHGNQTSSQQTQGNSQMPPAPTKTHDQHGNQTSSQQNTQQTQGNSQMPPAPAHTLISVKQLTVHGQLVTVLTTFTGMTLYERTSDPAPGSNCTGQCAHLWPPLLSNGTVISTAPIGGNLTVHLTANGKQVEYNGHPLYTYAGDKVLGQSNGQGVGNVWHSIPVTLQRQHW